MPSWPGISSGVRSWRGIMWRMADCRDRSLLLRGMWPRIERIRVLLLPHNRSRSVRAWWCCSVRMLMKVKMSRLLSWSIWRSRHSV